MTRTMVNGFTLVEMTEEEAELEFGYDFSAVPGAVKELSIEESDGLLVAYETEDGRYVLYISGRGIWQIVDNRNQAVQQLIIDATSC